MRASKFIVLIALSACAADTAPAETDTIAEALAKPKADIKLADSDGLLVQTSNTPWTLVKTGVVDTTKSTVTWTLTATAGATVGGHLTVNGYLNVNNIGTGPATIGNIVVNLQTRGAGDWVTQSSDIADATNGDAATTANVVNNASSEGNSFFAENAASGTLSLTDRNTNTLFSITPEVSVPPGATIPLLFTATFDNRVLGLAKGAKTRTEVLVTFGNHAAGGPKATDINVDINGNGVIDPDEAKVRTVAARFTQPIPVTTAANTAVTLTDALADISTVGTVTFTNPTFTLGATTGTVSVTYNGGTAGGSITNCAHANGTGLSTTDGSFTFLNVAPVSLTACNTEAINPFVCTPGTAGCGWHDGDMVSYTQADWGDDSLVSPAATLLNADYNTVYASTFGVFEIGIHGTGGFSIDFTDSTDVLGYLPATGTAAPLDADLLDPSTSASGTFGGEVAALKLNVDFADGGEVTTTSKLKIGDLTLCNFTSPTGVNGLTVRQFLAIANTLLGGGSGSVSVADASTLASQINGAFFGAFASTFSQDHLLNGACP